MNVRSSPLVIVGIIFLGLAPLAGAAEVAETEAGSPKEQQSESTRPQDSKEKKTKSPKRGNQRGEVPPHVSKVSSEDDPKGKTPPEYKRPSRWGLTAGASQRHDWLTDKDKFKLDEEINARSVLGLPEWLDASLEQRTRYESYGTPWRENQKTGEDQIPLQTVLWVEAHKAQFRTGFELWNAVQSGAQTGWLVNNTMVNAANFTQLYAAWTEHNLFDSDLGFEAKGGRMTLDLGSRRLVARNNFRNTTNAFTGVQLRFRDSADKWHLLAFANQPIERLPTWTDDQEKAGVPNPLLNNDWAWNQEKQGSVFAGAMLDTWAIPWQINAELYLYYYYVQEAKNGRLVGLDRELVTPGLRVHRAAKKGEIDFEVETVGQTGQVKGKKEGDVMNAESYFEHAQMGYTLDLPFDPRLMIQYDYATGGKSGNTSHSFDTLFGARRWEYGPTGIFGPFGRNNINSPGTRLFLVPHRDLTSFFAYRAYWLADATAPWAIAGLEDRTGKAGSFIGQTFEFALRWDPHDNLAFEVGCETLFKGGFAKNAPGAPTDHSNVNYFFLQSEIRF